MDHLQNVVAVVLVLGTPSLAVIGGIVAVILRMRGQQRLLELVLRERIAAIEKGLDVSQLPSPADIVAALSGGHGKLPRGQGLMTGGMVTLAVGGGLTLAMLMLPLESGRGPWPVGLVPVFLGFALLIAGWWIRREDAAAAGQRRAE